MQMLEWKDVTSYAFGDTERIPKVWQLDVKGLKIKICRIDPSRGWYLSCAELSIYNQYLYTDDLEEAKNKGIRIVVSKIEELETIKYLIMPSKINYDFLWQQRKNFLNDKKAPSAMATLEVMENMERKEI